MRVADHACTRGSMIAVGDVDQQIDQYIGGGGQHDDALHDGEILLEHRLHQQAADAGAGEHGLRHHRAADQQRELDAEQRQRRNERVAHRVLGDDAHVTVRPLARAVRM